MTQDYVLDKTAHCTKYDRNGRVAGIAGVGHEHSVALNPSQHDATEMPKYAKLADEIYMVPITKRMGRERNDIDNDDCFNVLLYLRLC